LGHYAAIAGVSDEIFDIGLSVEATQDACSTRQALL
jgi:hypothetical protein